MPQATRVSERSARGLALLMSNADRPPANLSPPRLKPSRGRINTCLAAVMSKPAPASFTQFILLPGQTIHYFISIFRSNIKCVPLELEVSVMQLFFQTETQNPKEKKTKHTQKCVTCILKN